MRLTQLIGAALVLLCANHAQAQNAQALYNDAQRRAQNGSWTRALDIYGQILQIEPEMSAAAYQGAILASKLNNHELCALYYRNFLYRSPEAAEAPQARLDLEKCERRIPTSGTLNVSSVSPENLEIAVDGVIIGRGSVENVVLSAGAHTVRVEAIDFEPFEERVTIQAKQTASVRASLKAIIYYGTLAITVDQADAMVAIDGKDLGLTPLSADGHRMLSGRYLLTIDKPGFHRWQRYIDIPRNGPYQNDIRLLPEGARY